MGMKRTLSTGHVVETVSAPGAACRVDVIHLTPEQARRLTIGRWPKAWTPLARSRVPWYRRLWRALTP